MAFYRLMREGTGICNAKTEPRSVFLLLPTLRQNWTVFILVHLSLLYVFTGRHATIVGQHETHREWAGSGEAEEVHRRFWPGRLREEPKQQGPGFVKSSSFSSLFSSFFFFSGLLVGLVSGRTAQSRPVWSLHKNGFMLFVFWHYLFWVHSQFIWIHYVAAG